MTFKFKSQIKTISSKNITRKTQATVTGRASRTITDAINTIQIDTAEGITGSKTSSRASQISRALGRNDSTISLEDRFTLPRGKKTSNHGENTNGRNLTNTDNQGHETGNTQDPNEGSGSGLPPQGDPGEKLFNDFLEGQYEDQDDSDQWRNVGEGGQAEEDDSYYYDPQEEHEYNDSDPNVSTPNPMNDHGDTSDYDGRHDGLRGFRGDIDYGPDGKKGRGHDEKYDILIGFNPRIDYGPDGKPGKGYNGEHDDLKGLNPRIDWDRDHVDSRDFKGNALTDRLGKINPRAVREALENTSIADNGQQAQRMGNTNTEFIFDAQAGVLFHNANGSKKGFGSGGAIAEIGIDHDLSLVTVDFF